MASITIRRFRIAQDQFGEFEQLTIRRRWDWPAVFSTNTRGDIWPWVTFGRTNEADRVEVGGVSPIIDAMAAELVAINGKGGRFFIDERGAFFKTQAGRVMQFVLFEYRN